MQSIYRLILRGESRYLEFKREYSSTMLKTVCAFANDHDGTIAFGLSDAGDILGAPEPRQIRLKIENAINDNIEPRPMFELETIEDSGKSIVLLRIYKGEQTPYLYEGKAYTRTDTASVAVDRNRMNRLILAGQNVQFDESEAAVQRLEFPTLERSLRQRLKISVFNSDLMRSLDLMRNGRFTNAAALLSDENPVTHSGFILLVHAADRINLADRLNLDHRSVLTQLEESERFLAKHCRIAEEIVGMYRETREEVPLAAYREAVANAIIHRDYQAEGSIKIEFFPDRVEIISPGTLPLGLSTEEFQSGRISVPRNRILADLFMRLGIIDRMATGVRRIKESYQERMQQPEFIVYENSVTVILPRQAADFVKDKPADGGAWALSPEESRILSVLETKADITRLEAQVLLSLGKTRTYQILRGLLGARRIREIGSGKNTRYIRRR